MRFFFPLLLASLAGCSAAATPDGGKAGDLGNGSFTYRCVDPSDPTCAPGATTSEEFPTAIAVGGRFGANYFPKGSSQQTNVRLFPVSPTYLAGTGDQFTALRAGSGGIMARAADTGDVFDYLPVRLLPVARISLLDTADNVPAVDVSVKPGRQLTYRVRAQASTQQTLAGAVDYTWSVSDANVLTLDQGNPTSEMTVTAKAQGTADLTASYAPPEGGASGPPEFSIHITVTP